MLLNDGIGEDSWESLDCKEIQPVHPKVLNIHWKDWCWSWNSNTLITWCEELTHLKRPWYWERLKAGEEGDDRGWDDWMASLTRKTWVWINSRSLWWTERPGMLQSMGLQRVRHDWVTELTDWLFREKILIYLIKLLSTLLLVFMYFSLSFWNLLLLSDVYHFSSVQSRSHVQLFATAWTVACQVSLSITDSRTLLKLKSIESVMPSNHLILCSLLFLPSIFPSIRVFSKE